jgi:hypothetical protein
MPEAPVLPDEVVYGFGRMDVSGRAGSATEPSSASWAGSRETG